MNNMSFLLILADMLFEKMHEDITERDWMPTVKRKKIAAPGSTLNNFQGLLEAAISCFRLSRFTTYEAERAAPCVTWVGCNLNT